MRTFFVMAALLHCSVMPDTHTDRAKWVPLLVLATRKPVSALLIHSDSAQKVRSRSAIMPDTPHTPAHAVSFLTSCAVQKRESGHGVHWGVSVFAASQDKEVHRFTVSTCPLGLLAAG